MKPLFDSATHSYSQEGQHLPGVTSILSKVGLSPSRDFLISRVGRTRLDALAARGTAIHEGIARVLSGESPDSLAASIPDDGWEHWESWLKFHEEHELHTLGVEVLIQSHDPDFAGRLDWVGFLDGIYTVIDWKTGAAAKYNRFQLGAYALGWWNVDRMKTYENPTSDKDEDRGFEIAKQGAVCSVTPKGYRLRKWGYRELKEAATIFEAAATVYPHLIDS